MQATWQTIGTTDYDFNDQNLTAHANQQLRPQFNLREIAQIENFASNQTELSLRLQLEDLLHASLTDLEVDFTDVPGRTKQMNQATELESSGVPRLSKNDYQQGDSHTKTKPGADYAVSSEAELLTETEAASEAWAALL